MYATKWMHVFPLTHDWSVRVSLRARKLPPMNAPYTMSPNDVRIIKGFNDSSLRLA